MINPADKADIARLCESIAADRTEMSPFRAKREEMLKQFVGSHYGDTKQQIPVPLLEQAISIYSRALISRHPGVMISSNYRSLKPAAAMFQLACNHAIKKSGMERALRAWVVDAMFGLGVLKVGLKRSYGTNSIPVGQVIADTVPFDDFVWDTSATRTDHCRYMGNRYTAFKDDLSKDKSINWKTVQGLPNLDTSDTDDKGENRSRAISSNSGAGGGRRKPLEDQVELYDIYLVRERTLITLHLPTQTVLRAAVFDGPVNGPYHLLGFGDVPGNLMPLCPASLLLDLHDLANRLFRKVAKQAERQKVITIFQGGSDADMERVKRTGDGGSARVDRAGTLLEQAFGGADPKTFAMFMQTGQLFDKLGGNLSALGGLSPQSGTLGQDELLNQSASQRVAEMQSRLLTAAGGVMRDFAFYIWTDRLFEPTIARRLTGFDLEIPVVWTAEDREGDFIDFNLEIDPTSMGPSTPQQRLQSLVVFLEKFVIPLMPFAQAQGITPDMEPILREAASCLGRGDVDALLQFAAGAQNPAPGPTSAPAGMNPNTNRTYTRVNRPGNTAEGQESSMIRQLMGAGLQDSEADAATRPIS